MKRWTAWMLCVCLLAGMAGCAAAEEEPRLLIAAEYKKGDLNAGWDAEKADVISLNGTKAQISGGARLDGQVLTISGKGDYLLSGEFAGRIVVDADKDDKVRLIFAGLKLTSEESAAVFVRKADKVTLTLADGSENTVVSGNRLIMHEDEALDAAVYSKADLVVNGRGSLTVVSPRGHGILSKDDLRMIGGRILIDAAADGLRGRDAVMVYGGEISVTAGGDGIKSNNDEDADRGYISMDGGAVTVSAGGDGVKAETVFQMTGGELIITRSYEGMEAQHMLFAGGTARITAAEDGLNAAGGTQKEGHQTMTFAGSEVFVNASGDGLDSNGAMRFEGGAVYVSGPVGNGNGALDASGRMTVSGGVLLAAGSSGMAAAPEADGQAAALLFMEAVQPGGAPVSVRNAADEELASFTPEKDWSSLAVSLPGLREGDLIRVYVNGAPAAEAKAGETAGRKKPGGRHG